MLNMAQASGPHSTDIITENYHCLCSNNICNFSIYFSTLVGTSHTSLLAELTLNLGFVVIKLFFMLDSTEHEIDSAHKC